MGAGSVSRIQPEPFRESLVADEAVLGVPNGKPVTPQGGEILVAQVHNARRVAQYPAFLFKQGGMFVKLFDGIAHISRQVPCWYSDTENLAFDEQVAVPHNKNEIHLRTSLAARMPELNPPPFQVPANCRAEQSILQLHRRL